MLPTSRGRGRGVLYVVLSTFTSCTRRMKTGKAKTSSCGADTSESLEMSGGP